MDVKRKIVTRATGHRPTGARVTSRRELPAHISAYIAHLIREWEAANPRKPLQQLATKLKVSRATLIGVRDGWRGAGSALESSFARVFHGGSVDELREAARRFEAKGEAADQAVLAGASELRLAIEFLQGAYPPAFLADVEREAAALTGERTRLEWLDWIRAQHGPWSRKQANDVEGSSRPKARATAPAKRKSRTGS